MVKIEFTFKIRHFGKNLMEFAKIIKWTSEISKKYEFFILFSESEDEVEELERVPSPDVAPEESAHYYDPTAW